MTMQILSLNHISKRFGTHLVLDGVDLSLNRGQRIALVGENGAGKTTIARIILGHEDADSGAIRLAESAAIGYLPQDVTDTDHRTIQTYIEMSLGALDDLRQRMTTLERQMTAPLSVEEMDALLAEYGRIQETFDLRGGYDLDARMAAIFDGLGITYLAIDRPLHTLSGGERTRVALAALLLSEPELLILDEPTNHLDFAGIDWLERYLADYPHALLLITHDRAFIDRVANVISELNVKTRRLHTYHGNYGDYLAQREREYDQQVNAYNDQNNELRALKRTMKQLHNNRKITGKFSDVGDKFLRHFKRERGESLVSKTMRDTQTRLDQLQAQRKDNPRHEWHVEFRFAPVPLGSAEPLNIRNLSAAFDDQLLFEDINAIVPNGERIVLVAPNGTGKTTLLRIIRGLQTPQSGSVTLSPSVRLGYLDQDGETLNPDHTALDVLREVVNESDNELQAMLHRSGLWGKWAAGDVPVSALSVGQRRKLGLARLIASRANLLLLDEPTNHLDPLSLEALEDALLAFSGTMLAVSHDRRFVEKVATRIWRIENHQLLEERIMEMNS